jgi:integrase
MMVRENGAREALSMPWLVRTVAVTSVERYLKAAERENTQRSYASALRHFEIDWKGFLPATQEMIGRYLADHATTLSLNTLKHRLAALSCWHTIHGFPDPTKAFSVQQILKGIRTLHPVKPRQARPLQLETLQCIDTWLRDAVQQARGRADFTSELRFVRDRALILLGFWRGFRADELVRLRIEHVEVVAREGLVCFLPYSKGDRNANGRSFRCPAFSRLCPVAAYESWLALLGATEGPVFRAIDWWGHLAHGELAVNSVIPMLRRIFSEAGISDPDKYSGHSLRRGFAGWANASGWDFRALMEYVGWRDVRSAMRYVDENSEEFKEKFERGLLGIEELSTVKSVVRE